MATIAQMALDEAHRLGLNLSVEIRAIPTDPFRFRCLKPKWEVLAAFQEAAKLKQEWVPGMPFPVVTFNRGREEYEIMDGMMRICAAVIAGFDRIPAYVASGETYDALEPILRNGYYGEDFVEMLALAHPDVARNLRLRDDMRLAGK